MTRATYADSGLGRMLNPGKRGGNPTGLSKTCAAVAARRRIYAEARESGSDIFGAATAAGVDPYGTGPNYERWYHAGLAGGESR